MKEQAAAKVFEDLDKSISTCPDGSQEPYISNHEKNKEIYVTTDIKVHLDECAKILT